MRSRASKAHGKGNGRPLNVFGQPVTPRPEWFDFDNQPSANLGRLAAAVDERVYWLSPEGQAALRGMAPEAAREAVTVSLRPLIEIRAESDASIDRILGEDNGRKTATFRLLQDVELFKLPDPEWLVTGFLPAGALAVLYGKPGAGKSFLGLDWAMSVATGRPWLGRDVRKGPALYVVTEGGTAFKRRVQAWRAAHHVEEPTETFFLLAAVNLLDPQEVRVLLDEVETVLPQPPALVVFDTLSRSIAGGDENLQKDMGLAVAGADLVRRATGACVLLPHHTRRVDDQERGSSVLRGAADAMFALKNDLGSLTLRCEKQKDAEQPKPELLQLRPVGESCVLERRTKRKPTLEDRVRSYVWAHPGCSGSQVEKAVGGNAKATRAALQKAGDLEDRGANGRQEWYPTFLDDDAPVEAE